MPYDNPKAYVKDATQATSKRMPATGPQGHPLRVPAPPSAMSPKHVRKDKGSPGKGQKTV